MIISPQTIFAEVGADTIAGLTKAKAPADHFRMLENTYNIHDRLLDQIQRDENICLACKAGCNFCCYIKVDAHAHEVFFILEYLSKHKAPDELKRIKERCQNHYNRVKFISLKDQFSSNILCPLNFDNKCCAYPVRPFSCRTFHAQRIDTCKESYSNPTQLNSPDSQNLTLKLVGTSIWSAFSLSYSHAKYDPYSYDLGCALFMALDNPHSIRRWRNKKSAFPKDCISKDQQALD